MQLGIYDEDNRLTKLSKLGDSLEKLSGVIDWEMFRRPLTKAVRDESKAGKGRPPYDVVLMFKILVLQRIYNLSDDQTEFQINDRRTFSRFLGLSLGDTVPDAKTIWLFRDTLTKAKVIDELFDLFGRMLEDKHLVSHTGSIVDATFVEAPRQRNTREENEDIKEGKIPEEWKDDKNVNKMRQKDVDARWTKKRGEAHYGFKDHLRVDADSKLITKATVTGANVHDSQELAYLIDEDDKVIYADSAYTGAELFASLPDGLDKQINEKGYRGHPLTEEQKESNRKKSKIRARIEHVFAHMSGAMHGLTVRSIGYARAEFNIVLTNLVYNMMRYEILCKMRG